MGNKSVLIVDDEKNIRLTLSQTLESIGMETDTAINGEDALNKIRGSSFDVILLDLKMPGMDGMEVLKRIREKLPRLRVIIITAHGTIESAVEAMKLGAVDFIQKPFSPQEIRDLVSQVIDRDRLDVTEATSYSVCIELAKKYITDVDFVKALEMVKKAISLEPSRPEAFNFMGAILEIRGERLEAQKQYRAALALNSTYEPARKNLYRSTDWEPKGDIILENSSSKSDQSSDDEDG